MFSTGTRCIVLVPDYCCRSPWVVPGLWEVVKSFLPSSTITKIHILGSDFKEKLRAVIDPDQLVSVLIAQLADRDRRRLRTAGRSK